MSRAKLWQIVCFSAIHFGVAIAAFLWSFSVSSDAFEGRQVSWMGKTFSGPLTTVLWSPVMPLIEIARTHGLRLSPLWQWLLLAVNSLVWGVLLATVLAKVNAMRKRRGPSAEVET